MKLPNGKTTKSPRTFYDEWVNHYSYLTDNYGLIILSVGHEEAFDFLQVIHKDDPNKRIMGLTREFVDSLKEDI